MSIRLHTALWIASLVIVGAGCTQASNSRVTSQQPTQNRSPSSAEPERAAVSTTAQPAPISSMTTIKKEEPLAYPGILPAFETAKKLIRIKTNRGEIVLQLLPQEGPRAASNFVHLVKRKFYDGLTFHRVVPNFVIQGGDPLGNGTGGPGYAFEDDPVRLPYTEGIVAMANAGPNTNGSQFFIMLADTPLPPQYSIFGRVVSGMEVVKQIQIGDRMQVITIETERP